MLGTVPYAGDTIVSESDKNARPQGAYVLVEETASKINKTYNVSRADKGHRGK